MSLSLGSGPLALRDRDRPADLRAAGGLRARSLLRASHSTHCPFKGDASYWSLDALANVLWAYREPLPDATFLAGYAALYEKRIDAWFVEDDRLFGSLRDPFHRVDVHDSSREVVVSVNGEEVARTTRPKLLFETSVPVRAYVPSADIGPELVRPGSGKRTVCPYKGEATYLEGVDVTLA